MTASVDMTTLAAARPHLLVRAETAADETAREGLLDLCFGPARFAKTSERLREGRLPAEGLALAAEGPDGRLVGTVRLWNVSAGPGRAALLLGPLAVHPWFRRYGLGTALMASALNEASARGHKAVLLVGDAPYYGRFGFTRELTRGLWMPGPVDDERFLGLELKPGALAGARGLVQATGALLPVPSLRELIARSAAEPLRLSA